MSETVRLFLAIELDPRERRAIRQATASMRKAASDANWVPEDNLHLSLKFFGEQPDSTPAALQLILAPVGAAHPPFDLHVSGLGAFPNLRSPRVVWMGVQHDPRLELMHHDVEATCASHGYPLDARAFRPHITIARVRDPLPLANARALALAARAVVYKGIQQVSALYLIESTLGPRGPRYATVATIPLGGG